MLNKFHKCNDKKILHKIKKQWVTISLAIFMMMGMSALATHVTANASSLNNKSIATKSTNSNTIINKAHNLHSNIYRNQIRFNTPVRTMQMKAINADKVETGYVKGIHYKAHVISDVPQENSIDHRISLNSIELTHGNLIKPKTIDKIAEKITGNSSDVYLGSYKIDNNVNTKNASNLSYLFSSPEIDTPIINLYLGQGFNTKKAYHSHSGMDCMIPEDPTGGESSISKLTITSPNTIFRPNSFGNMSDSKTEPDFGLMLKLDKSFT